MSPVRVSCGFSTSSATTDKESDAITLGQRPPPIQEQKAQGRAFENSPIPRRFHPRPTPQMRVDDDGEEEKGQRLLLRLLQPALLGLEVGEGRHGELSAPFLFPFLFSSVLSEPPSAPEVGMK